MDTARVRELLDRRDRLVSDLALLDQDIATTIGGNGEKKAQDRKPQACSICGSFEHNARKCPNKDKPEFKAEEVQ